MKTKVRKIKLSTKITLAVLITTLLVSLMVGSFSIIKSKKDMMEISILHTRDVAQMAAGVMDADILTDLKPGEEDSPGYQQMLEILQSYLVDGSDIAYIYTMRKNDGNLEFVVDADQEEGAAIGEPYETYDVIESAFAGNVVVDEEITTDEWGSVYSGFAPVFDADGNVAAIVGVDTKVDSIDQRVSAMLRTMIIIEFSGFIIALVIALVIGRMMTGSVLVINEKMEELSLSGGDLTARINLSSGDEIETLSESFNRFLQKLREMILSIQNTETQLLEFSRETDEQIYSADGELCEISGSLSSMKDALERTALSAEKIRAAATDALDLSNRLYESSRLQAENAGVSGKRAKDASEDCGRSLKKVGEVVEEIAADMDREIAQSERIKEIEKLTGEIVGISNKTQLLALNASIEAARAGEAGRGFAVVADEISSLSDATTKTAKEIGEITQYTVSTVEELVQTAERMVNFVKEEIYSDFVRMEEIGRFYHEDTDAFFKGMQEFYSSCEQLAGDISQIEALLSDMSQMTESETAEATTVSQRAGEISSKMKAVRADTQINESMIRKMGELIGQFKV